ncbi:hypothetical protein AMS68_005504 [Peltaster fructicola]|uniref:Protein kinase domain-containing protein n=1 Tax=Peltaster fructicola TaxID=286661 RepID=A0A6H0XZ09_9PEZI|nr:hypothetical protein AMS68_005504 [Peltaster fructicola]
MSPAYNVTCLLTSALAGLSNLGLPNSPDLPQFVNGPLLQNSGKPWGWRTAYNCNAYDNNAIPYTGMTRFYDWTITNTTLAPDGVVTPVLLANGQFQDPRSKPTGEIGSKLQLDEGTALHWHGFLQSGTPWMDGTPAITQCPIPPGQSFTYLFRAELYGTSWWHGHYSAQYINGLAGPIVVYGPKSLQNYDIDIGPVMLSDWYHSYYLPLIRQVYFAQPNGPNFPPMANNVLINGKANYPCEKTTKQCTPDAGLAKFSFKTGKRHLLRLINHSAEAILFFSIDGYQLEVIANDFVPIVPYMTDLVTVAVGQRTDIIVTGGNNPDEAVWMRVSEGPSGLGPAGATGCSLNDGIAPNVTAAIYYESASTDAVPTSTSSIDPSRYLFPNACQNSDLSLTHPAYEMPVSDPDVTINILMTGNYNATGAFVWYMNNVTFIGDYNDPIFLDAAVGQTSFDSIRNVYNMGNASSVRFVMTSVGFPASHPMHVHGHNFQVLAAGFGTWDGTIVNASNPQRRDTQLIAPNGYLVVQIELDNPGVWAFHCHVAWHISEGMNINILEKPSDIVNNLHVPGTAADNCRNWSKLANSYQSLLNEFSSCDLTTVGNYSVGKLIGKGSFGKVYLASHKLTNGSKVVLKSAKKEDANLAREIHHHRQFLHPHIARLYEVIVTESMVWLVLEYCPGDELYNHLSQHGRMETHKAQKTFTQLVGAVSYVHGKQCVHRDLKLENILLDKNGNVKLVDFGFTREYQGTTSYLQTWCGTVCYSAPEMLKGEKYAGEKVDVWSLGIILYALLCGELPFDEDDDAATKALILKEEPNYHDYIPQPAKDLLQKLLSKRPLLRPSLSDVLKDPWLTEHAPQQQEILKIQQPAPFTTDLEKETLQRMRSAGVDIDQVIENVLSQRCDALAGWWALLMDKEVRKQRRRDRKRKEREAEVKALRRLSAASGRLLGALNEGEEIAIRDSPGSRGRRLTRTNGSLKAKSQHMELPQLDERRTPTPEPRTPGTEDQLNPLELVPTSTTARLDSTSRSRSRPAPPPKDMALAPLRRPRAISRNSSSMLRNVTNNPDLLGPAYVPPARKRRIFYQQPLREQIAALKHWIKEGARRNKSPHTEGKGKGKSAQDLNAPPTQDRQELARTTTGPITHRKASIGSRPELTYRATLPARPRVETDKPTITKRQSLSPHTLTPLSSYRRSSVGLRGRKSTSSSVSSIRSTFQPGHIHTLSKASSTSSNSVASPGGVSVASARLGRSPHSSVKVLPGTPSIGVGVRSRKTPAPLGTLSDNPSPFTLAMPASPGLPIFARRKRSVFKGPIGHTSSPSGFGRVSLPSRSGSMSGRRSGEIMPGVTEEDENDEAFEDEDDDDDGKWEEVDQFGPELPSTSPGFSPRHTDGDVPVTPLDEIDARPALVRKDVEDEAAASQHSTKVVEVSG